MVQFVSVITGLTNEQYYIIAYVSLQAHDLLSVVAAAAIQGLQSTFQSIVLNENSQG
jgi:hypothetical protein